MNKWVGIGLALGLLTACDSAGGLRSSNDSPYAPSGTNRAEDTVDGLIVGHRLMAVGEYDLALKAYLRAAGEQGTNADVLSALGSANLNLGRLGQAETLLRSALKQDEKFVPAWNNLGVALMEQGKNGEAERVFRTAFALDSGESAEIRDNLRLALAKSEKSDNTVVEKQEYKLVQRGSGDFLLRKNQD